MDFTANWLRLMKDLLVELPSRLKIIVVLGFFILGVMIALIHIRGQIIGKAATILSPHLVTGWMPLLLYFCCFWCYSSLLLRPTPFRTARDDYPPDKGRDHHQGDNYPREYSYIQYDDAGED